MLNSRYAPPVALTVLLLIVVGALTWFVGISPQLSQAANYMEQAKFVDAGTAELRSDVKAIETYRDALKEVPEIGDLTATIMPATFNPSEFREKLDATMKAEGVSLLSMGTMDAVEVSAWTVGDVSLPSNEVASHFESTPYVPIVGGKPYSRSTEDVVVDVFGNKGADGEGASTVAPAAVVPPTAESPLFDNLIAVPITMTLMGSGDAVNAYLQSLQTSEGRLFLLTSAEIRGRGLDENPVGSPPAAPGQVVARVTGVIYVYGFTRVEEQGQTVPAAPVPVTGAIDSPSS